MIETSRRAFITGLVSFVAAPAIVRAGSLMPVKVMTSNMTATQLIDFAERMTRPPILLDCFDMDAATRGLLEIMAVPPQWTCNR